MYQANIFHVLFSSELTKIIVIVAHYSCWSNRRKPVLQLSSTIIDYHASFDQGFRPGKQCHPGTTETTSQFQRTSQSFGADMIFTGETEEILPETNYVNK